ncbi:MAG: M14 family metallopeptidase [Bacteroidia bacterium]|nr:M14 family metallopeptidase [Bacteroidia bacterium]
MKRTSAIVIVAALSTMIAAAQPSLNKLQFTEQPIDYFLNEGTHSFDRSIPTPFEVLGYNIGDKFVEWSDVLIYMDTLEEASPKVSIKKFGRTWEGRQFIQVAITSEKNQRRLEEIRQEHLALTDTGRSKDLDIDNMPVVVDLMASIHGNEASGVSAAVLLAYYFTATTDADIIKMLDNTVVLITPGLNPDGINKNSSWLNSVTSLHHSSDNLSYEYNDPWPSPRSNKYWMDCNRDWLSVQQPEGRNCVSMYLEWMPDVVLDMHEQSNTRSGFYFSPGDKNRTYEHIPAENQEWTQKIADNTAKALDEKGIYYFSRQGYDDFFIGKGAAYGDLQGSVCILHEQGATYAMARPTDWGRLEFATTVRSQAVAALSVAKSAYQYRTELLDYQRRFYIDQAKAAAKDPVKAVRFRIKDDKAREFHLLDNLLFHGIEVYEDSKESGWYVVPMAQKKYYIFKAMWDRITEFKDDVFYDVSTWSFPYAYGAEFENCSSVNLGKKLEKAVFPAGSVEGGISKVGYAIGISEFYAPYVADQLLKKGYIVRAATKQFTYQWEGSETVFPVGTLVVPVINQKYDAESIYATLCELAAESGVKVTSFQTGRMKENDLGASMFYHLREPHVAIIAGSGMSSGETGEAWLAVDARFDFDHTLINHKDISASDDLSRYNVMIVTSNATGNDKFFERIAAWVKDGGTLILNRGAYSFVKKAGLGEIEKKTAGSMDGVILQTSIKKNSPIFWGYSESEIPVYKMATGTYTWEGASVPMKYTDSPYISGYLSEDNAADIPGTPAIMTKEFGDGLIIFFADDMNWRSYWYGTQRAFINAILFSNLI